MEFVLRNNEIIPRKEATTDIDDRGYQFGDGIYEVIRFYEGRPFLLGPHLERLWRSAGALGMALPFTEQALAAKLEALIEREGIRTGILYLQITRGVHPRTLYFPPKDLPLQLTAYARALPRPQDALRDGVRTILVPDIRWLRCDIKNLNLLPNTLARQKAEEAGCAEALQHRDGTVTEGSFSNVYRVNGGTVETHPESNLILSGITRAHVIGLCSAAGIPVTEKAYSTEALLNADEVFITSTTNEVMPVVRVDEIVIGNGVPGPVTRRLQALFEASLSEPG